MSGPEFNLAEKPAVQALVALGYRYLRPSEAKARVSITAAECIAGDNESARDAANQVMLRDECVAAIQRINGVDEDDARAAYQELLGKADNENWLGILRGDFDRKVKGQSTNKTIRVIDFTNPGNNSFVVTNQLYVKSQASRIPDVVCYVNGIPLVVIEAKKPVPHGDKATEAFDQIKQYERDVPRLFFSNVFNMVTDDVRTLYGATHAPSQYWAEWKDPWPKKTADFGSRLEQDLYALLAPERLLDLIAHFVVFETVEDTGKTVKKICRYQQFRAVNKIVDRVVDGEHNRGLVWHTQGSGKSLTMVFTALKLKKHLTLDHASLHNLNLLVLTDRIDLDTQISGTFAACKLPNPKAVRTRHALMQALHSGIDGQTLLSTIFKFEGSKKPIPNSARWVVMVDECHRTQEKDLGAYLRATMTEDARFFGFTGTPIKKSDKDTYANFGAPGEGYLDKYGIDDAVADGATVPIRYTSRKTEWQVDATKVDMLFDHWFANEDEETLAQIKKRGVTVADLAKHPARIRMIAQDVWIHFKAQAKPDGYKAQIVAIDREAVILYKRALNQIITEELMQAGMAEDNAFARADAVSVPVYSSNQEDAKPSEDAGKNAIRKELVRYALDKDGEVDAKSRFKKKGEEPSFLIVCNKLLTGFDAPVESVMYLDNPLKEHSLLQAIARTNRVADDKKEYGLIVDYIGVTKHLDEALASYRSEDVAGAMVELDQLRAELKKAHADVLQQIKGIARNTGDVKKEYDVLVQALGTEDAWYNFYRIAKYFVRVYQALSPDTAILDYQADLKWIVGFLAVGTQHFEKEEFKGLKNYSEKIRAMLEEHLKITGITTVCKLRNLTDPKFRDDFDVDGKGEADLKQAAVRKATELKKILRHKTAENALRYGPFSERLLELIKRFEDGLLDAAQMLKAQEELTNALEAETAAHESTKLNERAYGVYAMLEARKPVTDDENDDGGEVKEGGAPYTVGGDLSDMEKLAMAIDELYADDASAPVGWHLKDQLRKELRQHVRRLVAKSKQWPKPADWKNISTTVDDYARKHYAKVT